MNKSPVEPEIYSKSPTMMDYKCPITERRISGACYASIQERLSG